MKEERGREEASVAELLSLGAVLAADGRAAASSSCPGPPSTPLWSLVKKKKNFTCSE